jgi:hypothetical protein
VEFSSASDATRAAWAWRRYVTAARITTPVEVRPRAAVSTSAKLPRRRSPASREARVRIFAQAHDASAGRWRRDLTAEQLGTFEREAGATLAALGYA